MLVGGVDTHRFDLSSMIMLKDNHVWSQGTHARMPAVVYSHLRKLCCRAPADGPTADSHLIPCTNAPTHAQDPSHKRSREQRASEASR